MTAYALRLANSVDTAARVRIGDLLSLTPGATAVTGRTGIRPGLNAGTVAVVAGTMGVTVEPFVAWIQGGVSVVQGGYPFVLDAQVTLTLANGHASLSRTDVIAAVVRDDPFDSSGAVTATVEVVQGTPGGGVPAMPTNALPLRNVTIPAGLSTGTGGLASGNLSTDRRTYTAAAGGLLHVGTSSALPSVTMDGQRAWALDTDVEYVYNGTAWVPQSGDSAVTAATGVDSTGVRVFRRPGSGFLNVNCSIVAGAGVAAGATLFTIPAGFLPPTTVAIYYDDLISAGTSAAIRVHISPTTGAVTTTAALAFDAILRGQITYPM